MNNLAWQVLTVLSGKGGVGKTTISAALGAIYAELGYRVLLIDMDMGLRNLDLHFQVQGEIVFDLGHVLSGYVNVKDALIEVPSYPNLSILPSSLQKDFNQIDIVAFKNLLAKLREEFTIIILDAPAGSHDLLLSMTGLCDHALLVAQPFESSLRSIDKLLGVLPESLKKSIMINRVPKGIKETVTFFDSLSKIDFPILGIIHDLPTLTKAHCDKKAISHHYYPVFFQELEPVAINLLQHHPNYLRLDPIVETTTPWIKKLLSLVNS